ncbi:MAG: penicillin acylase family protein [Deltaproteobacteria bacterium]|nr:penicillin acylase family protein [Deltaproteobacteria bacterium]
MKIVKFSLGIIVAIVILAFLFLYVTLRSTLPEISAEITTDRVKAEITIIRDIYGVPHIFAENEHDAFFAVGYCQAQDRLWQMDIMRRAAYGRLSEVFGQSTIEDDRFLRTIFAPKSAQEYYRALPKQIQAMGQAYADGVNFYLENNDDRPPFEFLLLGYRMKTWMPEDTIAMNMIMAYSLNCSLDAEILRARLAANLDEEMLKEVFDFYPIDAGYIYPKFAHHPGLFENTLFTRANNLAGLLPGYHLMASNAWAVSGTRTVSGKPILADDSHMDLAIPNSYYQVHISTPEFTIHGGSIPGTPLVVEGHSEFFAWGLPTGAEDPSDFYVEKIRPGNPPQYLYEGVWQDMRVKKEAIMVKGSEPLEMEIWLTRHGPIVSDIADLNVPSAQDEAVSLRWNMYDRMGGGEAFYQIMKARNWQDFAGAARKMACPGSTFVYADADGNIGMWAGMAIPIRKGFDGVHPLPGWQAKYEWQGYVSPEELPFTVNPESGYVAAANNRMVGRKYPYYIANYWSVPDRHQRIVEMIEQAEKTIDFNYMASMQMDMASLSARRIAPKIITALEKVALAPQYIAALDQVRSWDYIASSESVPASIFFFTIQKLLSVIYLDEMGLERFNDFIHYYYLAINAIYGVFEKGNFLWLDKVTTPHKETLDELIVQAFTSAVDDLQRKYSDDMLKWQWGWVKPLIFYHPIGKELGLPGRFLNDGTYHAGGSHTTVNAAGYPMDKDPLVNHGPAIRMIIDFSDQNNWGFIQPPGNSGNFMSGHYKDQTAKWLSGQYNPILLSRKAIEAQAEGTIVFRSGQ